MCIYAARASDETCVKEGTAFYEFYHLLSRARARNRKPFEGDRCQSAARASTNRLTVKCISSVCHNNTRLEKHKVSWNVFISASFIYRYIYIYIYISPKMYEKKFKKKKGMK